MKLFIKALPYAIAVAVVFFIGSLIYGAGQKNTQGKWDIAKKAYDTAITQKEKEYGDLEAKHRLKITGINQELSDAKTKHAVAVVNIHADYAKRMQHSQNRTVVYQRQAEGGTAECKRLASHAAQLDSTLEEGRSLVRELRETLGLRDSQLIELGNQIKADRILLDAPQ